MKPMLCAAALLLGLAWPAAAATKVTIGISGWTGFAPLTLAKQAGLFEKHGLDVTLKKVPQASRPLAIASGDLQCAATTVETWLVWDAAGVKTKQIFQLDKSYGADGMVVRKDIASSSGAGPDSNGAAAGAGDKAKDEKKGDEDDFSSKAQIMTLMYVLFFLCSLRVLMSLQDDGRGSRLPNHDVLVQHYRCVPPILFRPF